MMPVAIFYHCFLFSGSPPDLSESAFNIVCEQMNELEASNLLKAASHFVVGISGGKESDEVANLILPTKAKRVLHGLHSRGENRTIIEMEKWVQSHPGWAVLYFHSKGASHPPGKYRDHCNAWRMCMMQFCVRNWVSCVHDLQYNDSVGCHWLSGMGSDHSQNYWGGNFWWARSDFLKTIPPITARDRIKISGIDALESRFEAEVWIGNGPRLPKVRDYHPVNPSIRNACLKHIKL